VQLQESSPFVRQASDGRGAKVPRAVLPLLAMAGYVGIATACDHTSAQRTAVSKSSPTTVTIGVPEGILNFRQLAGYFETEGLVYRGNDGRAIPRIAESWKASPDALSWRMKLRPNVAFHDGTPVDATIVKETLEKALSQPEITALYPGMLDVKNVRALDSRTVEIDLRRPSSFLMEDLDIPLTKAGADGQSIGTGPYAVVENRDDEIRLRANEHYYLGKPYIERIAIRPYSTLRLAWASLLRSEIDVVSDIPADALEFVANESVETFSFLRHYAYFMAFNSTKPQLRAAAVRRALNAAIDREALISSVLKGHGEVADSPMWPYHWAYDRSIRGYSYDPSLATATFGALGLRLQKDQDTGLPAFLRLSCLVPQGHAVLEKLALAIQRQFYDVGIDLQLIALPLKEFDARIRQGHFDASIMDLASAPTLSRVYQFWRSPGEFRGLNVFGYRNEEVDKWLDRIRHASDDATVRAAASQLQRALLNDPPALFIAWNERSRAIGRRFHVPSEPGRDPLQNLRLWTLADRQLTN
jgi:peptide/nickel transport system substrate-binding protein